MGLGRSRRIEAPQRYANLRSGFRPFNSSSFVLRPSSFVLRHSLFHSVLRHSSFPSMSVAFEELEGSPGLEVSESGMTAWRSFRVAWADWPQFCRELIGSYRVVGGSFVFAAPLEFPGFPNLVVS